MTEQPVIEKPQELKQDQPQPEPYTQPATVGAQLPRPVPQPALAVGNASEIVQQLKQERERAQKEIQTFDAAIAALGSTGSNAQPLQPNPQSVLAAAQPAQTKPQRAPAAGQPPHPNQLSATAVAQPDQAKPKPAAADAKPPRSMAGRIIIALVVILILAAVGFGVWRVFFYIPPLPANIVPLSGRIEGDDSAVSPKTSGRILEIRVREGD